MEELLNLFGQTIKHARHTACLTQEALAEQAGITSRYITAIENENKQQRMAASIFLGTSSPSRYRRKSRMLVSSKRIVRKA